MSTDLMPAESARLAELEVIVSSGLDTFVTVGRALAEISTDRLYRTTHGTFVAYAQDRFGIGKSHAYRMISAAKVAEAVSPIGDIATESQARELVGLDDEQARGVLAVAQGMAKIQGREQPTTDDIRSSRRSWEKYDGPTDQATEAVARELTDSTRDAVREARELREFVGITASFDDDELGELAASDDDDAYAEQATAPEPTTVRGTDGKTYTRPPAPRRKPLPDSFWQAAYDLTKITERIERLADDDRFPTNADQVAAANRGDLIRAIDVLQDVVNRLPSA